MIEPITGAGLAEALTGINATMQGQTLSDAYNQKITGQYPTDNGPTIGFADYTSDTPAISGDTSGSISTGSGNTPVDVWNDYVENTSTATVSDTTGGVVSGSRVGTFVYSLMEENPGVAESVVKAIVPVAVPLDAAITAIAQALGVSMDAASLDAETKNTLVNSYLATTGAVYDTAKGLVTAWKDEAGHILFPQRGLISVSDALQSLGIGGEEGYTSELDTGNASQPIPVGNALSVTYGWYPYEGADNARPWYSETISGGYVTSFCNNVGSVYSRVVLLAGTSNSLLGVQTVTNNIAGSTSNVNINPSASYTHDGKTVYYFVGSAATAGEIISVIGPVIGPAGDAGNTNFTKAGETAWTMIYGAVSGNYPEGTSQSLAPSYSVDNYPVVGDLATSYDPDTGILGTEPLVPIHLTEDPYNSTGDTADPTDTTDEDNPGVVNPPIPLPIPDTKPSNPSIPLVNPSVIDFTRVEELVEELANTLDPQPGQSSGIIPVPPLPGITDPETGDRTFPSIIPESGPGFIHVYNPTPDEFVAFGSWLWVTYADATIDKILNNPFDGVIGAHELYATPNRGGRDNIRSAFLTCPTTADLVPNRYSEIDCGTVIVPEFYGNYLDYSPYSQAYIYLPFIGINEVSIDDIVGHAVNIRYRVDSYSGSCIAMIFVAKGGYQNLCYQFAGSCSVEVPMAGGSQAAIKAGMMQAEAYARAAMIQAGANVVGGVGSALMGNIGGVLSSLSGVASNYAQAQAGVEAARVANKSSVQHSGQFGASHGAMGEKVPFIIIRNPIQVKVVNYNEDYGLPAHKRVIVGGCRGYLRVREVNVISAHATDEEKMAIEMALKGGVYVS